MKFSAVILLLLQIIAHSVGLPDCTCVETFNSVEECVAAYWRKGYRYAAILIFLSVYHGIHWTLRQLKYFISHKLGLRRRGNQSSIADIRRAIYLELNGSGRCLGYRSMPRRLQHDYHLSVGKHVIRTLLQNIDPYGVNQRRRRRLERRRYRNPGPNGAWHIDGYDKLAPYGFHISGCIDGYSRRIMFLQVAATNHDPAVIACYYLSCVKQIQGCPRLVQTDCGTENVVVAEIQGVFCINAPPPFDGPNSHRYGSSPSNQRIEAWWSYYRKQNSGWWIDFFKDLAASGNFEPGNLIHTCCLQFCFMALIQEELDKVASEWNRHRIRPSRMAECPPGVPDELYFLSGPSGKIIYHVICYGLPSPLH